MAHRYLGNFSSHEFNGIPLSCDVCEVSWTGCAAAADCPECGRGQEYHQRAIKFSELGKGTLPPGHYDKK